MQFFWLQTCVIGGFCVKAGAEEEGKELYNKLNF
jgi:hypothetical protein